MGVSGTLLGGGNLGGAVAYSGAGPALYLPALAACPPLTCKPPATVAMASSNNPPLGGFATAKKGTASLWTNEVEM